MWSMLMLMAMVGCRSEMGPANYPTDTGLGGVPPTQDPNFFSGETAYTGETPRLFLSVFYEGAYSSEILIDDYTRFYYIWDSTFSQTTTDDRVEGYFSDKIVVGDKGWFGGGISYNSAEDLSAWSGLHLAIKSSDVTSAGIIVASSDDEYEVDLADYGYVGDGEWHYLSIPTADFVGVDWTQIVMPWSLTGSGTNGDEVLVDDVYYFGEQP